MRRSEKGNSRFLAPILLCAFFGIAAAGCSLGEGSNFETRQTETLRLITVLYTNDEHGWMDPYQNTGGAAGMARLWRQREGLDEDKPILILSGGDMWTGPALSTVWEGESMANVMNVMGYDAAAIGNHDFDFGLEALRERAAQSEFPFLSANIRESDTGVIPDFAQPYLVTDVNGIKVGLIGMTTTEAKVDTQPSYVAGLDFLPYRDVLPGIAAEARKEGAELLLVIGHLCAGETRALASVAAEHDIHFIGGGHCHQEINEVADGVRLVESGFFMRGYTRTDILFDTENDEIEDIQSHFIRNDSGRQDPEIAALIESWRDRTDQKLWEAIGYADSPIDRKSSEMAALLLEPWLRAWPEADVALASPRYVQQDLYPGEIMPATILGLLPTNNELVEVELTGAQLVETIESHHPLAAGLEESGGYRLEGGLPIDSESTYMVLVPEALYWGGNYYEFSKFDAEPTYTGIDWRQPSIDWIRSVGSSKREPISDFLTD